MKKMISVCLVLLVCLLLATAVSATAVEPESGDIDVSLATPCEHCHKNVIWDILPGSIPSSAGHYHYALSGSVTPSQLTVKSGVTVCLDLKGYGLDTNGRSFIVYTGATMNVMDSSSGKTGYISGSTGGNNSAGGTITVQENATLNLYSGTLKFVNDGVGSTPTYSGCVLSMRGTMNMYGGTVQGGELTYVSGKTIAGGAIHVGSAGKLTVTGGTITSGILPEGGVGACVYLSDAGSKIKLSGEANVEEIYAVAAGGVTVTGSYSGKARLKLGKNVTAADGLVVGVSDGATITGDLFCTNGNGWLVNISEAELVLNTFVPTAERHACAYCNEVIKWTEISSSMISKLRYTPGQYHVYLKEDYKVTSQVYAGTGATICLDLYGNTLTSTQRALYVNSNATLSVMDGKGGGVVQATTATNNPSGGVMVVKAGAEFNLYGGTLQLEEKVVSGYGVGVGGIVYMSESGTMNVYGGTVQGADLVISGYNLNPNGRGAAIYMANSAQLNVYGGEVKSGTLAEGCVGACVYLNSSTAKVNLYENGKVGDIYCTSENDQVKVTGVYTGIAGITFPDSIALELGDAIGVADNARIDGKVTCTTGGNTYPVAVEDGALVLSMDAMAAVNVGGVLTGYETLQKAVDNVGNGYVVLLQSSEEALTVTKDLYLDLNGYALTGQVTVNKGATLYGMDSQTDDYTVADGVYGKLTQVSGKVLGLPEESDLAKDGYMMITENGEVSFHRVNLQLKAMTLRPEDAGVYYKSDFAGDEMVAKKVVRFGVALSVQAVPSAANLDAECKYTSIDMEFTSGGMDADATSTLLKGIMKPGNALMTNNRNAKMPIFGRAYVYTEDGYMFGAAAQRTLQEQVEGVDNLWGNLSAAQKAAVVGMYDTYRNVMKGWDIPNVIAQKDPSSDGITKILGIGNSYTIDSMHLLNAVYQAEKPGTKLQLGIAYYSGCTLANHVKFYNNESAVYTYYYLDSATGKWVTTSDMTLQEIISAQNWDLVSMQQGSGTSGVPSTYNGDVQTIQRFVDQLLGYTPTFFWNMTWAYPEMDIPTDKYTLEDAPNANSFKNYYSSSQITMYNKIMETVQAKIVPDATFKWIMPVGTAVQNAQSSYMTDLDLYRDYTHLSDFARLMAAYTWYCQLEGTTLDSVQLTKVPSALKKSYTGSGDMVLTESQINVLVESVKNAANTKFQVTQSQYTEE